MPACLLCDNLVVIVTAQNTTAMQEYKFAVYNTCCPIWRFCASGYGMQWHCVGSCLLWQWPQMRLTGSVSCSNDIFTPLFQVFHNQTVKAQQSNGQVDAGEPFYLLQKGIASE